MELSPNAKYLAITGRRGNQEAVYDTRLAKRQTVWIVDVGLGKVVRQLLVRGPVNFRWSPDSQRLVLLDAQTGSSPSLGRVVAVTGGSAKVVGVGVTRFEWVESGRALLGVTWVEGGRTLNYQGTLSRLDNSRIGSVRPAVPAFWRIDPSSGRRTRLSKTRAVELLFGKPLARRIHSHRALDLLWHPYSEARLARVPQGALLPTVSVRRKAGKLRLDVRDLLVRPQKLLTVALQPHPEYELAIEYLGGDDVGYASYGTMFEDGPAFGNGLRIARINARTGRKTWWNVTGLNFYLSERYRVVWM